MRAWRSETFESKFPHCCGRMKRRLVAAAEKDKEATEEHYKDLLFDDFFHIWNLNEPLNLSFLSEDEQAEELANCESVELRRRQRRRLLLFSRPWLLLPLLFQILLCHRDGRGTSDC